MNLEVKLAVKMPELKSLKKKKQVIRSSFKV